MSHLRESSDAISRSASHPAETPAVAPRAPPLSKQRRTARCRMHGQSSSNFLLGGCDLLRFESVAIANVNFGHILKPDRFDAIWLFHLEVVQQKLVNILENQHRLFVRRLEVDLAVLKRQSLHVPHVKARRR